MFTSRGFPHSEIPGSQNACFSPRLIAAGHVLHRLFVPRHPHVCPQQLDHKIYSNYKIIFHPTGQSLASCLTFRVFVSKDFIISNASCPTSFPGLITSSRFGKLTLPFRFSVQQKLVFMLPVNIQFSKICWFRFLKSPEESTISISFRLPLSTILLSFVLSGGPGQIRTTDLTLIRGAL